MDKIGYIYIYEALLGPRMGWKYVGQTKDEPQERNRDHLSSLERKDHHSPKLRYYYNKYKREGLKFSVIMKCPESELNFWEKFWIKCFDSFRNGFNCTEGGDNPPIRYRKCTLTNAVTGETHACNSIKEFAQKFNLCKVGISAVLRGKHNHVDDWYDPSKDWRPKVYTIISPDNIQYQILDYKIPDFCREHKLESLYLRAMLRGQREATGGGWRRLDSKPTESNGISIDYKLVSPEGELIVGHNISELSRKLGLWNGKISQVLSGNILRYKGWRKYEDGMELKPLRTYRNGKIVKDTKKF